jgi:hypothetical protein
MHECPQCWQVCYCDLDDSNDCRDDGECFHDCDPGSSEDDDFEYVDDEDDMTDDPEVHAIPAAADAKGDGR